MNVDDLTIGQARQLAAMFGQGSAIPSPTEAAHEERPVIVCTDKRGVVFGYTRDVTARPIQLVRARMCLYWSSDVGGVFGLGEKGPTEDCRISAQLSKLTLEGVTAVFGVEPIAEKAWANAKVQGR